MINKAKNEIWRLTRKSGYIDTNGQGVCCELHGEGEPLALIIGIGGDSTM